MLRSGFTAPVRPARRLLAMSSLLLHMTYMEVGNAIGLSGSVEPTPEVQSLPMRPQYSCILTLQVDAQDIEELYS